MSRHIAFPLRFDARGRTTTATDDDHIRDLIEQILFTAPGERVNRPDFGSGLTQLVFAPTSAALAGTTQLLVQGALQQWLGGLIEVEAVEIEGEEASLRVTVQYTVVKNRERHTARFVR